MPSPGERQSEWRHGDTVHNVGQLYGYRDRVEQSVRRAAGVIARLSPQTIWETNVAQANEVYHHLPEETVAGLFHDKREPLQRGRGRAPGQPMHLNRQPSPAITHANAIATGKEQPEDSILTGDKRVRVGSFYENIAEPDTSV